MSIRLTQVKALSNESRMAILRLLDDLEKNFAHQKSADPKKMGACINLITEKLGVSQPTASRHIDILKRAGFLNIQRYQKWSYCSRNEEEMTAYYRWLRDELNIKST